MKKYIIFHGTESSPEANWFPWLNRELSQSGQQVAVPPMPTPEGQNLDSWLKIFDQKFVLTGDTVLIGHSIGAVFVARLLERSELPVKAAYLVSVWEGLLGLPEFDPLIESFFTKPIDWLKVQSGARVIRTYHGSNDPYVPIKMGQNVADKLGIKLEILPDAGHINADSGYLQFDLLKQHIQHDT